MSTVALTAATPAYILLPAGDTYRVYEGQLEKQGTGNGTGTGTGTGTGAGAGPERYRITSLIRAIKWV